MIRKLWFWSVATGLFGIAFPILLFILGLSAWDIGTVPTLSDYFHEDSRWLFVGGLVALAVAFLFFSPIMLESKTTGALVFVLAIGTAIFPTIKCVPCGNGLVREELTIVGGAHFLCAICLLGLFCKILLIDLTKRSREFVKLRQFFFVAGISIISFTAVGVILALNNIGVCTSFTNFNGPIFWLEAASIIIFSGSWTLFSLIWRDSQRTPDITFQSGD